MFATLNFPANSKRENPHNKLLRSSIYFHILYTVLASIKMNINLVRQIFFFAHIPEFFFYSNREL